MDNQYIINPLSPRAILNFSFFSPLHFVLEKFRFVSFRLISFRVVSFRFDRFRFVSFYFFSFRFVSHFTGTLLKIVSNYHRVKFCHRLIRCVLTNYFRYTIKLIMADVGQTGVSGEQSRRCLVLIQI